MPGIAGIISREAPEVCRRRLAAMVGSMLHEPSYQSGTYEAVEMGVYAGWVVHPGSFAARESGKDATDALAVVVAGECFDDCGSPVRVLPDTGVGRCDSSRTLLNKYEKHGDGFVNELNGLFSGILIDRRRSRVLLFNDRYAVERLYVHETEHGTYFASEAKALLRVLSATRALDDASVAQFLAYGCVLDSKTLFRNVRMLEGGSLWIIEDGSCQKRRYFTPAQWESQPALSVDDFQSEFQRCFTKAIPRYFSGTHRIGVSLTGGLDTRMIMACLPVLPTPPLCYTFVGLKGQTLDARIATRIASECGLEHQLLRIGKDFLADFDGYVDRTVYVTDGCNGPVGAHEIYLNAQARGLAPLRVTGNFGSEVLRAMSTLKNMGLSQELIAPDLRAQVSGASNAPAGTSPVTFSAFREIPWSLFGIMSSAKSQVIYRSPYLDNDLVALAYRAPESVRRSASSSLQLVREASPRLSRIPTDRAVMADGRGLGYLWNRFLAEVTFKLDYMHKEEPPKVMRSLGVFSALDKAGLLGGHKWLEYRLWFQNELATYVADALSDPATLRLSFLNPQTVKTMARDHANGTRNYIREINAVLTLATVDRLIVRGPRLEA
jgi:asparagine synthase (glutamine-hydrolysing)